MKKIAFLIDGGYLLKIFRNEKKRPMKETEIAPLTKLLLEKDEEIFRIYYYDAPPFGGTLTNPIDNSVHDYSKSGVYIAATEFQRRLAEQDYVAVRSGELAFSGWILKRPYEDKIKEGKVVPPTAQDIKAEFRQKGVDIKIGLDIANLAARRIVDKIVLISADRDFIPAMKVARREGIRIAVVKLETIIRTEMKQHSDQVINLDWTKVV